MRKRSVWEHLGGVGEGEQHANESRGCNCLVSSQSFGVNQDVEEPRKIVRGPGGQNYPPAALI